MCIYMTTSEVFTSQQAPVTNLMTIIITSGQYSQVRMVTIYGMFHRDSTLLHKRSPDIILIVFIVRQFIVRQFKTRPSRLIICVCTCTVNDTNKLL